MKVAKTGDQVAYSRNFLNSIQANAEIYDLRGKVLEVKDKPLRAKVEWSDGKHSTCLLRNLSKIASPESIRFAGAILEQY